MENVRVECPMETSGDQSVSVAGMLQDLRYKIIFIIGKLAPFIRAGYLSAIPSGWQQDVLDLRKLAHRVNFLRFTED